MVHDEPLFVARPLMPELPKLSALLEDVWSARIVTNEGPLHNRLEHALEAHLEVPTAKLVCNGTVALQIAILSCGFPPGAEIITTPLTFGATAHAIAACGLTPVFADVDEATLTIDPSAVERAITSKTRAVLGVHVYGTICDHVALRKLCDDRGLMLMFDAAHAFGAWDGETPVGMMGDLSVFSLHATKLFNTFEGGLITSPDPEMGRRLRLVRNFGIENEETVSVVGINGKMSELNAAVGLLNLEIMKAEVDARRALRAKYDEIIDEIPGVRKQIHQQDVIQSEQYYMIVVDPHEYGATRDDIYNKLKECNILSRRYFWPICTDFECYRNYPIATLHTVPVVEQMKDRVLCLPFHSGVDQSHIETISQVIRALSASKARRTALKERVNV